jgi:hypothetical protein
MAFRRNQEMYNPLFYNGLWDMGDLVGIRNGVSPEIHFTPVANFGTVCAYSLQPQEID